MSNRPIQTLRDGALSASIWKNEAENGAFYSVTFGRTYTDDNEQPHSADSFSGADLLRIGHLSGKAYDRINELRSKDKN